MRRHKKDMNELQIDRLRSRAKYSSISDEERWVEIFNILFPEAEKPPTPCKRTEFIFLGLSTAPVPSLLLFCLQFWRQC